MKSRPSSGVLLTCIEITTTACSTFQAGCCCSIAVTESKWSFHSSSSSFNSQWLSNMRLPNSARYPEHLPVLKLALPLVLATTKMRRQNFVLRTTASKSDNTRLSIVFLQLCSVLLQGGTTRAGGFPSAILPFGAAASRKSRQNYRGSGLKTGSLRDAAQVRP